jgi:hypothetical protein
MPCGYANDATAKFRATSFAPIATMIRTALRKALRRLTGYDIHKVGLYDLHYRNDKLGWADALFAHRHAMRTHAEAPRHRT